MRTLKIISAALIVCAISLPVSAKTIGSWSDAVQRGGDLATPGGGSNTNFDYESLSSALSSRGHTLVAGTDVLTTSYLSDLDVFFWGVSSHSLDSSEASALQAFVSAGGLLLVEADSSEQSSAESAGLALGLGDIIGPGTNAAATHLFTSATTLSTLGSAGDVRGEEFGSTVYVDLDASGGTVVASAGGDPIMAEFAVPGSVVLFVTDPLGFDLFQNPADLDGLYDADIQTAYINYIEAELQQDPGNGDDVIPEPLTMVTLTGLLGSLGGYIRKRRNA